MLPKISRDKEAQSKGNWFKLKNQIQCKLQLKYHIEDFLETM